MTDGIYRVEYEGICAGFVVEDGKITRCAPILIRKMDYWMSIATKV